MNTQKNKLNNFNQENLVYLSLSFLLSYLFFNIIIFNDTERVFLCSVITALILYNYKKSIRLCGVILIIIIFYIIRKNFGFK
jgi:hypothetical protein